MLSLSEIFAEPEACWQVAPPAAAHVQVPVVPVGSRSLTSVPGASEGPAFAATIVYVVEVPGTAVETPSVFVTETLVCGVRVSVSVAELLPDVVSLAWLTVAVLTRLPVAELGIDTTSVYVTEPPAGMLSLSEIF